jgi:formyltetrahydrofolate synthetase
MAADQLAELSDALRRAMLAIQKYSNICDGVILDVDKTSYTCSVQLNVTGNPVYYDVPMSVLKNSQGNFTVIPLENSACLMTFRDGNRGRPQLLFCDKIDEIFVTCNSVVFNGGSLGGLPITAHIVQKLNNLENAYNDLVAKYNVHTHISAAPGSPTAVPIPLETTVLTPTVNNDIENTKITQ